MGDDRFNVRSVFVPESPWDEVLPNLWVGGSERAQPENLFEAVVSVYDWHGVDTVGGDVPGVREAWLPARGVIHLVIPFFDSHRGEVPGDLIKYAAGNLAYLHDTHGLKVLVRCQAGLNRSAVVVAAYLIRHQKWSPHRAIDRLRKVRSPDVLFNARFVEWLEGLT